MQLLSRRSRRIEGAVTLVMLGLVAVQPVEAAGRVPQKSALKARIDLLYQARNARDGHGVERLVLPQQVEKVPSLGQLFSTPNYGEGHPRVIRYEIRRIEDDPAFRRQGVELCPGIPLRADAGARVFLAETTDKPGSELMKDVMIQIWVHVDSAWYWLVPLSPEISCPDTGDGS